MGVYIVGREGIWPRHNGMRAPILIESEGHPEGYPRADYKTMKILHDGDSWFIVYAEGTEKFENALLESESLSDISFEGLLNKILDKAKDNDDSKRTKIAKDIVKHLKKTVSEDDIKTKFNSKMKEKIQTESFNRKFTLQRPTKDEIIARNLHP